MQAEAGHAASGFVRVVVAGPAHRAAGTSSANARNGERTAKTIQLRYVFTNLELYLPLLKSSHTNFFLDFS